MEKSITTTFKVLNDTIKELTIIHEPECFNFDLPVGEELTIDVDSCIDSVRLHLSLEKDKIVLSILNENSLYNVTYKGDDVFEKYK